MFICVVNASSGLYFPLFFKLRLESNDYLSFDFVGLFQKNDQKIIFVYEGRVRGWGLGSVFGVREMSCRINECCSSTCCMERSSQLHLKLTAGDGNYLERK